MGEQVKQIYSWARRQKFMATIFVALTLAVGILIGSVVSGRVSAMKSATFSGTNATPLAVPDPIPASNSFSGIVNRVEPAVVNIATTQVMERRTTSQQAARPPARTIATTRCRISLTNSLMGSKTDLLKRNAAWVPA